jgi:N-acetylglucosamine transport system permease protein
VKRLPGAILLLFLAAAIVLPLGWTVLASLKTSREVTVSPWSLPASPQWGNYAKAWHEAHLGAYFLNSVLATVLSLAVLLPIGAMAAYVLAKFTFRGRNALYAGFLGGMMFPNLLVIVPLFLLLRSIGLLNTMTGLVAVYVAYSLSFTIFVLTGFFQTLPDELAEAAALDGASDAGTFWRIMLPLARPGVLVVAIFNAIGLWNEYSLAKVLISEERLLTLPLGIERLAFTEHYQSDWGTLFAALVLVMAPILALYWPFRDRIAQTMVAGAVK